MSSVLPVLLFALAGLLVGGAVSLYRQGTARGAGLVALLAMASLAGGILWLLPGEG